MTVTIISRKTRKLFTKYLLPYPSPRAAFRAAKRAARIPVAQQPDEVILPDTRLTGKNKHSFRVNANGSGTEQLDVVVDTSNGQVLSNLAAVGQKYRSLAFN